MTWNILIIIVVFIAGIFWRQIGHAVFKCFQFIFSLPDSLYRTFQWYRNYSDRKAIWRTIWRLDQVGRHKVIIKARIQHKGKNRDRFLKYAREYPYTLRVKGQLRTAKDELMKYIKSIEMEEEK